MVTKLFNFRCSEEFLKKTKEFAKSKDLTLSTLLRLAVDEYIKNHS